MSERKPFWALRYNASADFPNAPDPDKIRETLLEQVRSLSDEDIQKLVRKQQPAPRYVRLTHTLSGREKCLYGTQWNREGEKVFWSDFLSMTPEEQAPWIREEREWRFGSLDGADDVFVAEERLTDDLVIGDVDYDPSPSTGYSSFYTSIDLRPYLEVANDQELADTLEAVRNMDVLPMTELLDTMLCSRLSVDTRSISDNVALHDEDENEDAVSVKTKVEQLENWIEKNRPVVLDIVPTGTPKP